jgi:hypothetical protein
MMTDKIEEAPNIKEADMLKQVNVIKIEQKEK